MAEETKAVTLAQCPIGLFWHGDELCLKTEYGNNEGRIDAYIVSSGEFYWGDQPQTITSQRQQMVTPIDADEAITALTSSPTAADLRTWQPIETAPRDRAKVDLWAHHHGDPDDQVRFTDCHWSSNHDQQDDWWCSDINHGEGGYLSEIVTVTHWMPIAMPPRYIASGDSILNVPKGTPHPIWGKSGFPEVIDPPYYADSLHLSAPGVEAMKPTLEIGVLKMRIEELERALRNALDRLDGEYGHQGLCEEIEAALTQGKD